MRFAVNVAAILTEKVGCMFHLQISVTAACLNTHFTRHQFRAISPLEDVWFGGVVTQKGQNYCRYYNSFYYRYYNSFNSKFTDEVAMRTKKWNSKQPIVLIAVSFHKPKNASMSNEQWRQGWICVTSNDLWHCQTKWKH